MKPTVLVMRCTLCKHTVEVNGDTSELVSINDAKTIAEFADLLSAKAKTHVLDGKCMHEFEPIKGVAPSA